jgi:predicted esterase
MTEESDATSVETLHFETPVHGRVLLREARGPAEGAGLLLAFHGYGEAAEDILRQVVRIPGVGAWHVASAQALHPFYRRRTQEVVASWMTRQDRELAIADNVRYVNEVVGTLRRRLEASRAPLVYCGFSQGVAMAWRAAAMLDVPCTGLIVLGGDVPPGLHDLSLSGLPRVLLGRGRGEEAYSVEQLRRDLALLRRKGVAVDLCEFDGGHEWTEAFRARCGEYLERLAKR